MNLWKRADYRRKYGRVTAVSDEYHTNCERRKWYSSRFDPALLTVFPNNVMIFGRLVEHHIGDAGATP
jgi:hypothetical protein